MENIENYKNRFYNLMESSMGDVKPLINEESAGSAIPVNKEVFFDVYQDDKSSNKLGSVAMGVVGGPNTLGPDTYKLAATDKSEFPNLLDGVYLYKLGYLTIKGGKYILRPKK